MDDQSSTKPKAQSKRKRRRTSGRADGDGASVMSVRKATKPRQTVGWREWVALPDLGIPLIKAKTDTGARTSAIHATHVKAFERDDQPWVRFAVPRDHERGAFLVWCEAPLHRMRRVKNTGGHAEARYTILTTMVIGARRLPIELTLAGRDRMGFRMLLGRAALRSGRMLVDPNRSFLNGQPESA